MRLQSLGKMKRVCLPKVLARTCEGLATETSYAEMENSEKSERPILSTALALPSFLPVSSATRRKKGSAVYIIPKLVGESEGVSRAPCRR